MSMILILVALAWTDFIVDDYIGMRLLCSCIWIGSTKDSAYIVLFKCMVSQLKVDGIDTTYYKVIILY